MKKNIILFWGSIFSGNNGVNALTKSIIDNASYDELIIIGTGRKKQSIISDKIFFYPSTKLKKYLIISCLLIIYRLSECSILKRFIIRIYPILQIVFNEDTIYDIGEGDSFSDIYGLKRFFVNISPKFWALLLNKDLTLLPQTIGPFNSIISRIIAKFILRRIKLIYVRDKVSFNLLKKNMKIKNVIYSHDVAILLQPAKANIQFNLSNKKIGINISGLLYFSDVSGRYKKLIFFICEFFINKGYTIYFIPHVYSLNKISDDRSAIENFYANLPEKYKKNSLILTNCKYNSQELKYIISKMDFFIGTRMHSCIAALSQNIPTLALSYSIKYEGLFSKYGLSKFVIDYNSYDLQELEKKLIDIVKNRNKYFKIINKNNLIIKSQLYEWFKSI